MYSPATGTRIAHFLLEANYPEKVPKNFDPGYENDNTHTQKKKFLLKQLFFFVEFIFDFIRILSNYKIARKPPLNELCEKA